MNANEGEGGKIMRISTAIWDNGFPLESYKREKRSTLKMEQNSEHLGKIKKLETMHAISQIEDRYRYSEDEDNEDFPKEEDEEYEATPKGPMIEASRSESIPKSFTAYDFTAGGYEINKGQDMNN